MSDTPSGGRKFDGGKPDMSLIPMAALVEEAKAFGLGAKKYGRYNYLLGMSASRLLAAALRHISQYNDGEDLDPESGASHLGHARACLAMILHCIQHGTHVDDRFGKKVEHQKVEEKKQEILVTASGNPLDYVK